MNIAKFVSYIPDPVVKILSKTRIRKVYRQARMATEPVVTVDFKTPHGKIYVKAPIHSPFGRKPRTNQTFEPVLSNVLINEFEQSDVFYDIGAHFGYYSSLALKYGIPPHNIHSFEGDPLNASVLESTHEEDSNILVKKWVGSSSSSSTVCIDDYILENSPPSIVKIDTEGAEYRILKGMERCLQEHRPEIFIEVHPRFFSKNKKVQHTDVISLLKTYEYSVKLESKSFHNKKDISDVKWISAQDCQNIPEDDYLVWGTPS